MPEGLSGVNGVHARRPVPRLDLDSIAKTTGATFLNSADMQLLKRLKVSPFFDNDQRRLLHAEIIGTDRLRKRVTCATLRLAEKLNKFYNKEPVLTLKIVDSIARLIGGANGKNTPRLYAVARAMSVVPGVFEEIEKHEGPYFFTYVEPVASGYPAKMASFKVVRHDGDWSIVQVPLRGKNGLSISGP